jgi:ATP-dependent DNA helicase RecG
MAENQNIEYKESWRDEYLRWVCGFANAQGGKIYIGVDDSGNVVGVENAKKLMEDIPNKIQSGLGIVADVNLLSEGNKDYIEIKVSPSSYPISYHGEFHYRSGSTKQQLTGVALTEFLLKKTGTTWDNVAMDNVKIEDFRNDSFDIFREQALLNNKMDAKALNVSNLQLLDNLNLLEDGLIRRAAILLFHHNPEKWVPGAYIKIGYFDSPSEIRYQDELHGSLISQADRAVDLLYTKYLKAEISYEGVTRVETYPYPKEALREAIFNAIVHKRYEALIPIQISVYKDKICIANDCLFPEDWSVQTLLEAHRSRPYNPAIANTFYRAGYIESWGRGIQKILDSCQESGNEPPEYKVTKEDFMVMFRSLYVTDQANIQGNIQAPENSGANDSNCNEFTNIQANIQATDQEMEIIEKILELISSEPEISQSKIAEKLNERLGAVKYYMKKMQDEGVLERKGTTQNGYWKINR